MKVHVLEIPVPEDIEVMGMVFAKDMEKHIETEIKEYCEGCQINSDSQKDHCHQGSWIDQILIIFRPFLNQPEKESR